MQARANINVPTLSVMRRGAIGPPTAAGADPYSPLSYVDITAGFAADITDVVVGR
jgi:hypothetical protein